MIWDYNSRRRLALRLERRLGLSTDYDLTSGTTGVIESAVHELAHAAVIGVALDEPDLSDTVSLEIEEWARARGRRGMNRRRDLQELQTIAVELHVLRALKVRRVTAERLITNALENNLSCTKRTQAVKLVRRHHVTRRAMKRAASILCWLREQLTYPPRPEMDV